MLEPPSGLSSEGSAWKYGVPSWTIVPPGATRPRNPLTVPPTTKGSDGPARTVKVVQSVQADGTPPSSSTSTDDPRRVVESTEPTASPPSQPGSGEEKTTVSKRNT